MIYIIYPPPILVGGPTNNKTVVLEQQYEYDLFRNSNLLDKYLEKIIAVTDFAGTNILANFSVMNKKSHP